MFRSCLNSPFRSAITSFLESIGISLIWNESNLDASNYNINAGTFTFNSGNIDISGGTANFAHRLTLEPATDFNYEEHNLERWIQTVELTVNENDGDSYGFGVGVMSTNPVDVFPNIARFGFDTTGTTTNERAIIYDKLSLTGQIVGDSSYDFTVSTKYFFELYRNADEYICSVYSDSAKTDLLKTWTLAPAGGYSSTTWEWHNTGKWALWNFGGTHTIHSWKIELPSSKDYVASNKKHTFIGDSNTVGYKNNLTDRYINRLIADTPSLSADEVMVLAGIGDRIEEIDRIMPLIQSANNQNIFVCIGTNNKRQGDSDATIDTKWTALMDNIISDNPNSNVVVITPMASDSVDMSTVASNQISYATTNGLDYVDFFTLSTDNGTGLDEIYDIGDNLHGNALFHQTAADEIATVLPSLFPS